MIGTSKTSKMTERIRSSLIRQRIDDLLARDDEGFLKLLDSELLIQTMNELGSTEAIQVLDTYVDIVEGHLISGGSLEPAQASAYLIRLAHTARYAMNSPPQTRPAYYLEPPPFSSPTYQNPVLMGFEEDANNYSSMRSRNKVIERISPMIQQMLETTFCTEEDRSVLEDRALMLLLSKIPENSAQQALKKYQQTVQQRGRSSINNPCGYLISLLKKAQDRDENPGNLLTNQNRSTARPLMTLNPRVRAEMEKTFVKRNDRSVLEDVGLIKQLGRLDEDQAIEAIANYREASNRRNGKPIVNSSAYFMVILRAYIEGTTPIHSNSGGISASAVPQSATSELGGISNLHALSDEEVVVTQNQPLKSPIGEKIPNGKGYNRSSSLSVGVNQSSLFENGGFRGGNNNLKTPNSSTVPNFFSPTAPFFNVTPTGVQSRERGRSHSPTYSHKSPKPNSEDIPGFFTPTNMTLKRQGYSNAAPATSPLFTVFNQSLHSPGFKASPKLLDLSNEPYSLDADTGPHPKSPIHIMRELHREQRRLMDEQARQELQQTESPPQSPYPIRSPLPASSPIPAPIHKPISTKELEMYERKKSELDFDDSYKEVSNLLSKLGLQKYSASLKNAEVDMEALRLFEENDLKELGMPKGPRVKLMHSLHGEAGESGGGSSISSSRLGHELGGVNASEESDTSQHSSHHRSPPPNHSHGK
mmetsp:Transcript_14506/g.20596  ORF Transcript_14506/g.20596 Transcript_14506/m.20596 type:complete len:702 (-) Transcript_14506:185-2290(-)